MIVGVKQPLFVFKKPVHEAALPMSVSSMNVQSVGTVLPRELLACSARGTPDCTSSCYWLTPKFDVGSTSCSTPCSTRGQNTPSAGGDDAINAVSPSSSRSSSSSSAVSSIDAMQTSLSLLGETSLNAAARTYCDPSELQTESARPTDRLSAPDMHPTATSHTEQLRSHLTNEDLGIDKDSKT